MTIHGYPTTLSATTAMMALHMAAVAKGASSKFIIADLPFLSYRKGLMDSVHELMSAGAHAVKLEGVRGHAEIIRHIVDSGVPVMGHLGLTPQSVHQLGGMKVQARTEAALEILSSQARELEVAGCFAIVLECVPSEAARRVTELLNIPTIGIGAGANVSGQVLVYSIKGSGNDCKRRDVERRITGLDHGRERRLTVLLGEQRAMIERSCSMQYLCSLDWFGESRDPCSLTRLVANWE